MAVWVEAAGQLNARGHWVSGRIVLRPQRTVNFGRSFLALIYLLISASLPDLNQDYGEDVERYTLTVYALLAVVGAAFASRSWYAEALLRIPLLALDAIAFLVLITHTGGSASPYKAAFIFIVIVGALNLPKLPKSMVPTIAVIAYLTAIALGIAGRATSENPAEGVALNAMHMLFLGTIIAVFLDGGWRRRVQNEARHRLDNDSIFDAGYSVLELAVIATKKAVGAQAAHLLIENRGEIAAYFAQSGERTVIAESDPAVIVNILTLPPHCALIDVAGNLAHSLSQPPRRAYGPQLSRLSPDTGAAFRALGIKEAVLLPVQILDTVAYLLLQFEEPLTEAHILRAAQSRHRISQMVESYERRLCGLAVATERERQALWRNLHDGTVQSLAAVQFHLRRLTNSAETNAATRSSLHVVEAIISGEAQRLREMSAYDGAPVNCAKLLRQTAKDLGRKWQIDCGFSQGAGVDTAFHDINDDGAAIAQGLAFAMEEMVANGVRHGKASKITFDLSASKYALTLRLHGNGSPPTSAQALPKSLNERVTAMDGQLTMEPEPDGFGMQIVIQNRRYD